ncbi:MAG: Glucose-1-phosphate adenylyltransferase [Syntrophorhabdaceae bacterium PtaU1.Bin034]|nr:MAG: Glucose-1-phosphate adenylyltransferase [Syntrophorhabdaceae bacterium PtaU1.Bin034]
MKNILAMILAGGRVDELDVLTFLRPKSVLPFGALYRIIDFPMSNLMHSGIEKVGILSQYRPFYLINHIANGQPWDMVGRNRFAVILPPFKGREASDWYKGTADAVHQNKDFIKMYNPDLVLILSGDHIYKMDYQKVINFHLEKKADLTIAFTTVPREGSHRFGQGNIEDEEPRGGKLLQYAEKPKKSLFEWASLTIYVFNPAVLFEALDENARKESHEFGKDIIPSLLGNFRIYGYKHQGYWGYTRTLDEYWRTNMDLLGDRARIDLRSWQIRTNLAHREIRDRQPSITGPRAVIEDSLFYSGCEIRGKVSRSLLFPGVKVEEGAVVEDSILFFDTVVKREAHVARTIADIEVAIGPKSKIGSRDGELSVIGMGSSVPDDVTIQPGVTVYPGVEAAHFTRKEYKTGEIVK